MLNALWIRLDIPYGENATKMRAVLAYEETTKEDSVELLKASDCKNIPESVKEIKKLAAKAGIKIENNIPLVYPLDGRHGLAGYVLDEANKQKLGFGRHIPNAMKLPVNLETAYENFDTGSDEDNYNTEQAQNAILRLNDEANDSYNSNDLLESMAPLRHAMWLALKHFGWHHPAVVYTLRNFGYTLSATGNSDNEQEAIGLIIKLIYLWQLNLPEKRIWNGSESLLDDLAGLCVHLNAEELGAAILEFKNALLN